MEMVREQEAAVEGFNLRQLSQPPQCGLSALRTMIYLLKDDFLGNP